MPEDAPVVPDALRRVGAAIAEVPAVQAQADERGIQPFHDAFDLRVGLDVRARMGVDHRLESELLAQLTRAMEVVQHRADPGLVQLGFRMQVDASGVAQAVRLVDGLAQDGQGRRPLRGRVAEERQLATQPVPVGGGSIRAAEMPRQERAHQLQAAPLESFACRAAGAEVSGRSQLRALVADAQHPVEHLIGGRHPGVILDDLVHPERAGRTCDGQCGGHDPVLRSPGADHGKLRSVATCARWSIDARRTCGFSETSATGTSHQLS